MFNYILKTLKYEWQCSKYLEMNPTCDKGMGMECVGTTSEVSAWIQTWHGRYLRPYILQIRNFIYTYFCTFSAYLSFQRFAISHMLK